MQESDSEWVPSLHMDRREGNGRRRRKQRWTPKTRPSQVSTPLISKELFRDQWSTRPSRESEAAGEGPARPASPPWRDVTSLLQSHKPAAAVKGTNLSFRDFFRTSLEASLEVSSTTRALSAQQPSISGDCRLELNFKLPPLKDKNQTSEESSSSSSSSSCQNCVRLQRRIMELQEKLTHLPGEQENTEASPVFNKTPVQPDQELQTPEITVDIEEEETGWMKPLSPLECDGGADDQDVDSSPAAAQDNSSKHKKFHFQKSWLKTFWFLRYSPTLDQMWCHVCRLHADKSHQKKSLMKGSRLFNLQNIKKHSQSSYHKDNVEHHMWYVCDLKT